MSLTYTQITKLDKYTAEVMKKAHEMAMELVAEGDLSDAALDDNAGEASSLMVTVPGKADPYYEIGPMYIDPEDMDEGWEIELYVTHDGDDWEPMGFSVHVEKAEYIEEDLARVFGDFLSYVEDEPKYVE